MKHHPRCGCGAPVRLHPRRPRAVQGQPWDNLCHSCYQAKRAREARGGNAAAAPLRPRRQVPLVQLKGPANVAAWSERPLAEWLAALRAGDGDAFGWLYQTYAREVRKSFWKRPIEEQEDLTQDVFVIAMQRIHTFRGESEPQLIAWLRSIAFHGWAHLADKESVRWRHQAGSLEAREARAEARSGSEGGGFGVPQYADPARAIEEVVQEEALVRSLLALLTPGQRDVFQRHVMAGEGLSDMARRMGASPEKIRGLYKRAVRTLRTEASHDLLAAA